MDLTNLAIFFKARIFLLRVHAIENVAIQKNVITIRLFIAVLLQFYKIRTMLLPSPFLYIYPLPFRLLPSFSIFFAAIACRRRRCWRRAPPSPSREAQGAPPVPGLHLTTTTTPTPPREARCRRTTGSGAHREVPGGGGGGGGEGREEGGGGRHESWT